MKLPKGCKDFRLIRFPDGSYTTQIEFDGKQPNIDIPEWLRKHGKKLLEKQLGYKIREYSKDGERIK